MIRLTKYLKKNNGSVSTIVTVTIVFFVMILSAAFTVMSGIRKSQIKSQLVVKEMYQNEMDSALEIQENLINSTTQS